MCLKLPCILLPELLLMAWSPSKLFSLYLFLEFLNRAVNFLILLKVCIEVLEHLVDVFVNPVTVLKLNN